MRSRLTKWGAAISGAIDLNDVFLVVALTLLTMGLWTWLGRGALTAPGAVLLWIALPPRQPFLPAPPAKKERT